MIKLRINPIVAEDLKNIKEYIAEDNEEMAVKTRDICLNREYTAISVYGS